MNDLKKIITDNLGFIALIVLIMLLLGVYCLAYVFSQTDLLVIITEERYRDSLQAAYSLGRLDLITAFMAVVTVLLAVFGFIGYERVKIKSEETARIAVEGYLKENFEKWMSSNATEIIEKWLAQVENFEKVKGVIANDISMHIDPNND